MSGSLKSASKSTHCNSWFLENILTNKDKLCNIEWVTRLTTELWQFKLINWFCTDADKQNAIKFCMCHLSLDQCHVAFNIYWHLCQINADDGRSRYDRCAIKNENSLGAVSVIRLVGIYIGYRGRLSIKMFCSVWPVLILMWCILTEERLHW